MDDNQHIPICKQFYRPKYREKKLLPSSHCQGKYFLYSQSNRDVVFTYGKIYIRIRSGNRMVCFWNNRIWMSFLRLPPLISTFQSGTYPSFVLFPKFCYSNGRIDRDTTTNTLCSEHRLKCSGFPFTLF